MSKFLKLAAVFALLALCLASLAPAQNCNDADVIEHGTVRYTDVENGCWTFHGDSGTRYEIYTSKSNILVDGLTGTLYGNYLDIFTICQAGIPTGVCKFDADSAKTRVGTLTYEPCLEGGCWSFKAGGKSYQPFSEDEAFYRHGAKLQVQFFERPDILTFCMNGTAIEVLDYSVIQEGGETPTCGGGPVTLGSESDASLMSASISDTCRACGGQIACTQICRTLDVPGNLPEFMECFNACMIRAEHCREACELSDNASAPVVIMDLPPGVVGTSSGGYGAPGVINPYSNVNPLNVDAQ